jgi:hypothetical protein
MQDRPTAVELLRAAQEFCEKDLSANLTGRVRFHARVLQNVLAIIERELLGEEDAIAKEWERLGTLLDSSDEKPQTFDAMQRSVRERNVELAKKIRDGAFDDSFDEVLASLYETVTEKLAIANPNYASASAASSSTGA